jgi:hypothetical protein
MNWFSRLYRAYLDRPDPAWHPTTLRFTTARDYDEQAAISGARRARRPDDVPTEDARLSDLLGSPPASGEAALYPEGRATVARGAGVDGRGAARAARRAPQVGAGPTVSG